MKNFQSDIRHRILGDLHHLLSIANSDDLLAASQLCKSSNVSEALQLLAHELESTSQKPHPRKSPENQHEPSLLPRPSDKSVESRPMRQDGKKIKSLLEASPFLAKRHDAIQFVREEGFKLPSDDKASRLRIIAHLAKQIASKPKAEIAEILGRVAPNDQGNTSGWMTVIRKG